MIATELLEQLKAVKNDEHIANLGFKCIGRIDENYPSLPELYLYLYYRTWIWENEDGLRVAMCDEGNTWCHFMCEGTEEAIYTHISKDLPLLSTLCEGLSGNGIDKYKQFIKEIETRLSDTYLSIECKEGFGTPFEYDESKFRRMILGKDVQEVKELNDYQCVVDVSLTIKNEDLIKAEFHFEPHHSCYMHKTITYSIGEAH